MRLKLVVIRTEDIKALSLFYKRLGLHFDYHRHGKGSWHYSAMIEDTVFEIYPLLKHQEKADDSLRLGFEVDDLEQLIEQLAQNSVKILSKPKRSEFGYYAVIKDLDERKIELVEKPRSKIS